MSTIEETVTIQQLLEALGEPAAIPNERARVVVSDEPIPFIAPRLKRVSGSSENAFATDVVVISAPAAVGKSTLARYLSAKSRAPILNLAETPVSTHSLVGILQADFDGEMDPLKAFAEGRLPIILDALDEGRLLTGEKGFEQFILTTAELVNRDRSVSSRPKLVLFGRSGSSADAAFIMSLMREGEAPIEEFRIDYFDHDSARRIIEAYGDIEAGTTGKLSKSDPAQRAITAYFDAIARALALSSEQLWSDPIGRSFAGYAPVLATLGQALGKEGNPYDLESRLAKTDASHSEAWIVIDQVIDQMLSRESDQLATKLRRRASVEIPPVYGRDEQLAFLARWLSGETIRGTGTVSGEIADIYYSLIEQKLPEHPFVDAERHAPRNAVFGAAIFAHAIAHGLALGPTSTAFLEDAARQPFLWRFFLTAAGSSKDVLVDGRHLGYLLASLWTDPLEPSPRISMKDGSVGLVQVTIGSRKSSTINVVSPVLLYGSCQDATINISTDLHLRGATVKGGGRSIFAFQGADNVLASATLDIDADEMLLESGTRTWISSPAVLSSGRLKLQVKSEHYGWGGALSTQYPWSSWRSTISDPTIQIADDSLTKLVKAFVLHVGDPPKPFYVGWNYAPLSSDDDRSGRLAWMSRDFSAEIPIFVRMLIRHKLATLESVSGQGASRIRVSMKCSWHDLLAALQSPGEASDALASFVRDFKAAVPN